MTDLQTRCAFTGHRPHKLPWKYDEDDPRCARLKAALELRERDPRVRLHCLVPYEGQADRWEASAQDRYRAILARADEVRTLSRQYYDNCLLDRNRRLVESAGYLLAVYNGERRGGTAATIRYARKLGREIIVIDPASGLVAGK